MYFAFNRRKYVFKVEKTYSVEYARDCGFYYKKGEGIFRNYASRKGIFDWEPLILDWMAQIRAGERRGSCRPEKCLRQRFHGRNLTGVDGKHSTVHQTRIQKYGEQEGTNANSPRDVLGSQIDWRCRAACSGGRELPCEVQQHLEQRREGEKERWSLGEPRNLDEKLGRVLIS